MRVLITGAGGFIGRHLVTHQLNRGHHVMAVDLHTEALQPYHNHPRLRIIQGDFRDQELLDSHLSGQDVCFHLASAHLETTVDSDYYWTVNVEGTRNFLERCHQAGVGHFVHCSSVGVYGDVKNPPADEDSSCQPDIPYERSKLAGEQAVVAFAREHNYPLTVIRPAWVYGPGCRRTAKLFRTIAKGRFFFVGNGRTLRHPIYVDDMVAAFEKAALNPGAPGETYIIAGPRAVTLRELADEIAATQGVAPPRLRLPKAPVWLGCLALETVFGLVKREAPFTRRSMKFFTGNTSFSTRKAAEQLGFEARTDLREGLRLTYEWLQHPEEEIVYRTEVQGERI